MTGNLAAYLALVHICGIMAPGAAPPPVELATDVFTVWSAAESPTLRRVLKRSGETVICPALGTRYPWAA